MAGADKQERSTTAKLCTSSRKDGEPCGAWACTGSDFCFMHDPAKARERHRARQAGGHARHGRRIGKVGDPEPVTISEVADLLTLLTSTVNDLLALENSIARGRALLLAVSTGVKVLELGELEERVKALEELL